MIGSEYLRTAFTPDIIRLYDYAEWSRQHFCGQQIFLQPLIIKGEDGLGAPGLHSPLQGSLLVISKLTWIMLMQLRK
jgi:hypothetical protein